MDDPIEVPVSDLLDLHPFSPRDVPDLVVAWIEEARSRGYTTVKIVHGKGSGTLRETVHAVLAKAAGVEGYSLDPGPSSWGATIVRLRKE